ncbi:hypothetical protein D3OALGA1CA_187 [Olavius algarvensis associated proteobacterium Delta 3]|nr:hypothetical protein D3OALGA1CA_187 [Olavius algarvensis associated proteobacterium Delta 3]CAB5124839.1 hypothetical protein D3OALGB2SA_3215 [Olavius algarvensis associated proteobacterium Delta 3]
MLILFIFRHLLKRFHAMFGLNPLPLNPFPQGREIKVLPFDGGGAVGVMERPISTSLVLFIGSLII